MGLLRRERGEETKGNKISEKHRKKNGKWGKREVYLQDWGSRGAGFAAQGAQGQGQQEQGVDWDPAWPIRRNNCHGLF